MARLDLEQQKSIQGVGILKTQAIVDWWKLSCLGSHEGQPVEHLDGSRDSNKVDLS